MLYNPLPNDSIVTSYEVNRLSTLTSDNDRTPTNICMMCGETVHQGDCILSTTEELMTFTTCGEVPNWQQARYPYIKDLEALEACTSPNTCRMPSAIAAITTPLLADQWEKELENHPDRQFASYIVSGIRSGFHIGFNRAKVTPGSASRNMPSTDQNPQPVREYLRTEVEENRIVQVAEGMQEVVISRFGLIPKKGQANKWRLIQDLSYPSGESVNDGIDRDLCSLTYVTVDKAVDQIISLGKGALLAKIDVKHAYRNIPVHPEDRHLLGMKFEGKVYLDTTLPFGLRSAPKIFTAVADALEFVIRNHGVARIMHYLDDYLTLGPPGLEDCSQNLATITNCCHQLGVPLKQEKVEGPTTCLEFLGIILDTAKMELRLSDERIHNLEALLVHWDQRKRCRKRELLSLIGKLAHASTVVRVGRIFLRRLINLSTQAARLHHWLHLSMEARADIAWWKTFLEAWNHRSMMCMADPPAPDIIFSSDASGTWGCGASWGKAWLQLEWSKEWSEISIAAKELVPIVLACAVWGKQWQGKRVLVWCDNLAVVQIIRGLGSRDPLLMHLLRLLYFFMAAHSIQLTANHIPGVHNTIADSLSRNFMQVFRQLLPAAHPTATEVPDELQHLLVTDHEIWLSPSWRESLKASLLTV